MTPLEHSDTILLLENGQWLEVSGDVEGGNVHEGGTISYKAGDRLRIKSIQDDSIVCHDEAANQVWFRRADMSHLKPQR